MAGTFNRKGLNGRNVVYRHAKPGTTPPVSAGDPEYEREQPVSRDDRAAMLRRHFAASGMTDAQIEAAVSKAKV